MQGLIGFTVIHAGGTSIVRLMRVKGLLGDPGTLQQCEGML